MVEVNQLQAVIIVNNIADGINVNFTLVDPM
jgi:hypothetical protein